MLSEKRPAQTLAKVTTSKIPPRSVQVSGTKQCVCLKQFSSVLDDSTFFFLCGKHCSDLQWKNCCPGQRWARTEVTEVGKEKEGGLNYFNQFRSTRCNHRCNMLQSFQSPFPSFPSTSTSITSSGHAGATACCSWNVSCLSSSFRRDMAAWQHREQISAIVWGGGPTLRNLSPLLQCHKIE